MAVCRSEPSAPCRSIWPNARAKRRWERCHSQQREEQCSCQYRQGNAAARHRHSPEALSAAASLRSTGARRSVQSHPGQGTVFSVELPVVSGGGALPDAPRDEVLSASPTCTAALPVIDDKPGIASALAMSCCVAALQWRRPPMGAWRWPS
jgi:hypothetical protein